jgi:DNA-binding PadR family transcriptional regulator
LNTLESENEFNFYPLMVECIVEEETVSFADIRKYVEKKIGEKVNPDELYAALSKLQEYGIVKLNEDTTGTFSLQNWKK